MDWKLLLSTFVTVFSAEIGDKTQVATFSLAAGSSSRWSVFLGSSLALVAASAIAVLLGDAVARAVPLHVLKRVAGVLFVGMGAWMIFTSRGAA